MCTCYDHDLSFHTLKTESFLMCRAPAAHFLSTGPLGVGAGQWGLHEKCHTSKIAPCKELPALRKPGQRNSGLVQTRGKECADSGVTLENNGMEGDIVYMYKCLAARLMASRTRRQLEYFWFSSTSAASLKQLNGHFVSARS